MCRLFKGDITIYNRNTAEAEKIYNSIFIRQDYNLVINNDHPIIIDCGAHIGLATIFFKRKFPLAKITAIEANPHTVKYLEKNVIANQLQDVKIIHGALSEKSGMVPLYIDPKSHFPWSWDDSIIKGIWNDRLSKRERKIIYVPTVRLSDIIKAKVDLIKMDIEGAEYEVIKDSESKLELVDSIVLEFHPSGKTPISYLNNIRTILKIHKFKIKEYPVDWAIFISATK